MEIKINKTSKTNVKPFVFVLMPFHPDFDDIYQVGIKAACLSVGAYCERVDEQIFVENMLDRVYNQIAKADIVISEMTGRNPNVFYETGYAHALRKQVVLLTQNVDDIPFDLKHYPHIVYGGKIAYLKAELEKRIRWHIENPADSISNVNLDFELFINGVIWQEELEINIPYKVEYMDKYGSVVSVTPNGVYTETGNLLLTLQIGAHNISGAVIEGSRYHVGLIAPTVFSIGKNSDIHSATLKGENSVIRLSGFFTIFPDDWGSGKINFSVKKQDLPNSSTEFVLRLFSELGAKDYKFKVNLVPENGG